VFAGRVPHADVQRYYELIDVLAYPRRRMRLTELVTPLKPLEAMAQGRMFVASDVGGHRELVRHGETGFLCGADDARALARALEAVFADASAWPRIAHAARRYVETERTWARSVRRYQDVYAAAVEAAHRVPSARAAH
jgi:glycosyltransferase involved in cell wall biosynthesis